MPNTTNLTSERIVALAKKLIGDDPDADSISAPECREIADFILGVDAAHQAQIDALQARLDAVMLEFCPDEMGQAQLQDYAAAQVRGDLSASSDSNETGAGLDVDKAVERILSLKKDPGSTISAGTGARIYNACLGDAVKALKSMRPTDS